jgi:hypothetical protein
MSDDENKVFQHWRRGFRTDLSLESLVLPGLDLASVPELFPDQHLLLLQALRVLLDLLVPML